MSLRRYGLGRSLTSGVCLAAKALDRASVDPLGQDGAEHDASAAAISVSHETVSDGES